MLQQQNSAKIKAYFQKLQNAPQYHRVLEWGKLISITGAAQVFVQAVGFISGILVIRFLSVEEYAYYTVANTIFGTMVMLADGGISTSVLSQGGKVWGDKERLGTIVSTGLDLRKKFAIGSLIVSLPILAFLLLQNGASWSLIFLASLTLIPAFYAELSDSLLDIAPRLHQDIPPLQKNQVLVGAGRLLLTVSIVFLFPFTFVALIANGLPRIYGNIRLRKIAEPYISREKPDREVKKKILASVKKILPGAIYYSFSGQITVWILSILGNTKGLAQLGALGKFGMALSLISAMVAILLIPRFARQKDLKPVLSRLYIQIVVAVWVLLIPAICLVYFFPTYILTVLGAKYVNLELELLYIIIGSALGILCGVVVSLNMSRNWIINPFFSIALSLISIVLGIMLFDVSELRGVLLFNIFLAIVQLAIHGSYGGIRINRLKAAGSN